MSRYISYFLQLFTGTSHQILPHLSNRTSASSGVLRAHMVIYNLDAEV